MEESVTERVGSGIRSLLAVSGFSVRGAYLAMCLFQRQPYAYEAGARFVLYLLMYCDSPVHAD